MHQTGNDLQSNTKSMSIALLNARLADLIDLALLTKQAHWHLKGPRFIAIHEMLDGFRGQVAGSTDTVAERVTQLGGSALGTAQTLVHGTSLPPYPADLFELKTHLAALIDRYARTMRSARQSMPLLRPAIPARPISSPASRGLDKSRWFLEAHVQDRD